MYKQNEDQRKSLCVWLSSTSWAPAARIILYCLPYAGGDVSIFSNWRSRLPSFVEVCPIKLPGRGARIGEPAGTSILWLAAEIAEAIKYSSTKPHALFGHSMGALLAFEITRAMRNNGGPMPLHLFASGCAAPHIRRNPRITHHLPDAELVSEVQRLNGTPPEFFDHPDLVSLLLPMLRADFRVCETYAYRPQELLDVDITVLGGDRDPEVTTFQLNAWRELTTGRVSTELIPGDHFFLHQCEHRVLDVASIQLEAAVNGESSKNDINQKRRPGPQEIEIK